MNKTNINLILIGGISSLVWLWYIRINRVKRRPNVQPTPPDSSQKFGHFVQLSKGRTFYRLHNEICDAKLPPVVLCHGFIGSSEYFLPLIEALEKTQRRIYALDLYGRGFSDFVDLDHGYDLFVEQLAEFVREMGIDTPYDLLGYSMGGGICVKYASQFPSHIRSLTLIAPVGLPSMTGGPSTSLKLLMHVLKKLSSVISDGYLHEAATAAALRASSESMISEGWTRTDTPCYEWYRGHMLRRLQNEKETLHKAIPATMMNLPFNNLQKFYDNIGQETISFPILVLWGESDKIVPCDRGGAKLLIPRARVIIWPNEGHMLPIEHGEEVGEVILEFWKQNA